ncbi:MAG: PD40 domain-containing protein, partial [Blastocatellia bacterium]|nr:PD40 domain-containing protein [Blastocatellia bacterium]
MTFEDAVGLKRASDVQISPDGRRVAFVLTSWDRENDRFNSDIWLAFDSREPAIPLTSHPRRDDQPRWSPDGRCLAFLSERAANDPASPGAQIFLLNLQGGEPIQLTFHK